jgi:tetrahydromethanopterin S-methyltransferase subunit G
VAFRAGSYSRYEGPRSGRPAWWPLMTATLRRGRNSKWVRWITLASVLVALGMMVFFYVLNKVLPDWREIAQQTGRQIGKPDLAVDAGMYLNLVFVFVYPILLPLSLLFGSELVAGDLKTNALESYFSRPMTPFGYILGRTLAYAGFLLAATLLPLLIVWCSDVLTAPAGHLGLVGGVPWGMIQSLTLIAVVVALMVQATATFTRSGFGANIALGVVFVFFHALGHGMRESSERQEFLAISFLHDVYAICAASLGVPCRVGRQVYEATGLSFAVVIGLGLASFLYLWRTLRRRVLVG